MAFKKTKEEFIISAKIIHGDLYDYSKVQYINSKTPVVIECTLHGEFSQIPNSHLNGNKCPKCSNRHRKSTDEFINECITVHGIGSYDYSNVVYKNNKQKIKITCTKHNNEFEVYARSHLNGVGCTNCKIDKYIPQFKTIHGDKYSYEYSIYNGHTNSISIECPIHGMFEQNPFYHLDGCGCPKCGLNVSHGENLISKYLNDNGIEFFSEYRFSNCKYKNTLPFDFYIPIHNICIEFDGEQHYNPVEYFGGAAAYNLQIKKDNIKTKFCENAGINLIRISFKDMENIEEILNGLF